MFKDVKMKNQYYKEKVMKELLLNGQDPTVEIENILSNIDKHLAIFKHINVTEGKVFDVDSFNDGLLAIQKDLQIIYLLLKEITLDDFSDLKSYVDTHLDRLEDVAAMYKTKAMQEANSTSLGNTILFQNSNYKIATQNNNHFIDLGELNLRKGSRVSCIVNANNIEADKLIFGLQKEGQDTLYSTIYNYNQDSIVIPGDIKCINYETVISENQIINGPITMDLDGSIPNSKRSYIILGGKNKIITKSKDNNSNQIICERPTKLNMLSFDSKSYIEFFVVGGNNISFKFNKKPIYANFDLNSRNISNLNHIHHFFIECDENFAFDFELDTGEVYAVNESGIISNNKLFFSRAIDIKDFLVKEYFYEDKETYNAFVRVVNDDGLDIDIDSILIKELLEINNIKGVIENDSI